MLNYVCVCRPMCADSITIFSWLNKKRMKCLTATKRLVHREYSRRIFAANIRGEYSRGIYAYIRREYSPGIYANIRGNILQGIHELSCRKTSPSFPKIRHRRSFPAISRMPRRQSLEAVLYGFNGSYFCYLFRRISTSYLPVEVRSIF